jgi:hypothetical protein
MTMPEIFDLRDKHPTLLARAIWIESVASNSGNLKTVKGLGRRFNWKDRLESGDTDWTGDTPISCDCYDVSGE